MLQQLAVILFTTISDATPSPDTTEKNKKNIIFSQQDSQTHLSDTSETSDSTIILAEQSSAYYYWCYHCSSYQSNDEVDYKQHNVLKHPGKGAFPNKAEIEKRGLKAQGKPWET